MSWVCSLSSCCKTGATLRLAMGIAGAGNSGTLMATLFAPRLAQKIGWHGVFGVALIPLAKDAVLAPALPYFIDPFCTRHSQQGKPFVYGPSGDDAELPVMKQRQVPIAALMAQEIASRNEARVQPAGERN